MNSIKGTLFIRGPIEIKHEINLYELIKRFCPIYYRFDLLSYTLGKLFLIVTKTYIFKLLDKGGYLY